MSTYKYLPVNNFPPTVADLGFYADVRFDADDSVPVYIGLNTTNGADITTDTNWKIYKFTYSGSAVTRIQLAYGAWAVRATLFT